MSGMQQNCFHKAQDIFLAKLHFDSRVLIFEKGNTGLKNVFKRFQNPQETMQDNKL